MPPPPPPNLSVMAFSQLNGINFAQGNTAASQSGQKTPLKMNGVCELCFLPKLFCDHCAP